MFVNFSDPRVGTFDPERIASQLAARGKRHEDEGYGSQAEESPPGSPLRASFSDKPWVAPVLDDSAASPDDSAAVLDDVVAVTDFVRKQRYTRSGIPFTLEKLAREEVTLAALLEPPKNDNQPTEKRQFPPVEHLHSTSLERAWEQFDEAASRCRKPKIELKGSLPIRGLNLAENRLANFRVRNVEPVFARFCRALCPTETQRQIEFVDRFTRILRTLASAYENFQATLAACGGNVDRREAAISQYEALVNGQCQALRYLAQTAPRPVPSASRQGMLGTLSALATGLAGFLGFPLFCVLPAAGIGATVMGAVGGCIPSFSENFSYGVEQRNTFWDEFRDLADDAAQALEACNEANAARISAPIYGPLRNAGCPPDPVQLAQRHSDESGKTVTNAANAFQQGAKTGQRVVTFLAIYLASAEKDASEGGDAWDDGRSSVGFEELLKPTAEIWKTLRQVEVDSGSLSHRPVTGAVHGSAQQAAEEFSRAMAKLDALVCTAMQKSIENNPRGKHATLPSDYAPVKSDEIAAEEADDDIFFDAHEYLDFNEAVEARSSAPE